MEKVALLARGIFKSLYSEKMSNSQTKEGFQRSLLKPKQAFGKRESFFGQNLVNLVSPLGFNTLPFDQFLSIFFPKCKNSFLKANYRASWMITYTIKVFEIFNFESELVFTFDLFASILHRTTSLD